MNEFLRCVQQDEAELQLKKDLRSLRRGVEAAEDEQEILHCLSQIGAEVSINSRPKYVLRSSPD